MPDEVLDANSHDSTATSTPARKPRSPVERAIVWTVIAVMLVLMALQLRAHVGFSQTESAIRAALDAVENSPGVEQKTLTVENVPDMIHGSPDYSTEPIKIAFSSESRVDTYTWGSVRTGVLKPYVLRLYFGVEGKQGFGAERRTIPADLVRYEIGEPKDKDKGGEP